MRQLCPPRHGACFCLGLLYIAGMNSNLPKEFESYRPKVAFCIDEGSYLIKTAETKEELWGAFHLRHNVFCKERKNITLPSQIKTDEFDIYGDQLVIIDKQNLQVVGTYRMIPSRGPKEMVCLGSGKFFDISSFVDKVGGHNVVEMEWACTDKSIRASRVFHYIWLGMARYFRLTFSKYLCGRVDLLKSSVEEAGSTYQTFIEHGLVDKSAWVCPHKEYAVKNFDKILPQVKANEKYLSKISRLFSWYFKMGARVHGPPMFDPEGRTYDFFMSLDFKQIKNLSLVDRYEDAVWLKKNLPI